jgi:hypothetical protein
MCDLAIQLVHFVMSKCGYLSARRTPRVSHSKNGSEFLQRESRCQRVPNEKDPVERFGRIAAIATRRPWWLLEYSQPLIVPQGVCAYPRCSAEGSGAKSPLSIFVCRHTHSINPGICSRVKNILKIFWVSSVERDQECGGIKLMILSE